MAEDIVELKVEGMSCSNCAASLNKYLERKGLEDVYVNFQTKEVRYNRAHAEISQETIKSGIHKLGFEVVEEGQTAKKGWTIERKLLFSAIFTLPLLLHHLLMTLGLGIPGLENYWVQFVVCLPVFVVGFLHFGRSGLASLKGGIPNMDVLIFIGSTAAFVYSLVGTFSGNGDYIFYETSATIITLVLLGNWLEKRAVDQTTTAIGELTQLQAEKARKINKNGEVEVVEVKSLHRGDILQVNEGDKVPLDGTLLEGHANVDESMLTGESMPVEKEKGARLIGGTLVMAGHFRMEVKAVGKQTVLSRMIELVKTAQEDKPDIQRLADKISAIFVPVVLAIALGTLLIGHFVFGLSFQQALMNGIAVLVISCPCAMGLATPTAVMVGVGRLAKNGILVKGGDTLELLTRVKQIVFDKTGTLTTGTFALENIDYHTDDKARVHSLIYELEKHSSHPIAQSLLSATEEMERAANVSLSGVEEHKGIGLSGVDAEGNAIKIGSSRLLKEQSTHNGALLLMENDQLLASIHISDQLKTDAANVISFFRQKQLHTAILSGDKNEKTAKVAAQTGVDQYFAEQLPEEKLDLIGQLSQQASTAMVGDGVNDAPALAKADIGIAMSGGSQAAIKSARIVLLDNSLSRLQKAFQISEATVLTIKQNLFWAFAYNVVAIPIAAMGFLNPMWGALFMAFSDVVVIGNSIRLKYKKVG